MIERNTCIDGNNNNNKKKKKKKKRKKKVGKLELKPIIIKKQREEKHINETMTQVMLLER
jgi:hypothetical protein